MISKQVHYLKWSDVWDPYSALQTKTSCLILRVILYTLTRVSLDWRKNAITALFLKRCMIQLFKTMISGTFS